MFLVCLKNHTAVIGAKLSVRAPPGSASTQEGAGLRDKQFLSLKSGTNPTWGLEGPCQTPVLLLPVAPSPKKPL